MKIIGLFLFCLFLLGCSVSLTPQEQAVRITSNPELVKGCEFKGEVVGKALIAWTASRLPEKSMRYLKRNAHAMGADTVLMTYAVGSHVSATSRGEAYDCSKKKEKE